MKRGADWPAEWPAPVVVRGMADVDRACAAGRPVVLLSAPGAALFAGVGFWRALAGAARTKYPHLIVADVLDCADAPGLALAAIRVGQRVLILRSLAPGFATVLRIAAASGVTLLDVRPDP